jgi:transcriptional regulator with XRE-family HTH domain
MLEPLGDQSFIGQTLQQARRARRYSQLELSLRLSVSQRHISFVESGRAKPSRALLVAWLLELDLPLSQRNAALMQAGFAPIYGMDAHSALPSTHALVLDAIKHLLNSHDPMPAFVLDADWNVVQRNQGAYWLMHALMPELMRQMPPDAQLNMIDAMLHPQGFTAALLNADIVAPAMLRIVRQDARHHPPLQARAAQLSAALKARFGAHVVCTEHVEPLPPVLTSCFASAYGELRFFSMFTTFGTPQHITLASLRIEHLFAADAQTRQVMHAQVLPMLAQPPVCLPWQTNQQETCLPWQTNQQETST